MGVIVPRSDADALIAQAMFRMQAQQRAVRQNFDTDLGSTPEEAEAQCELIRNDLAEYTRYVHQMEPQRHHLFWIDLLQKMEQRAFPQRKLLLLAPPNMAKSTYVSLIFVKWYLGRHPNHSVLFLTSADTNAGFFGSTVRAGLSDDFRHRTIFPEPACRPNVKRGWSSDGAFLMGTPLHQKDPAYRNVGWGASIIGARANVVIVDDPLSQKQAESPTEQSFAKRYHDMTVVPRLQRPDDANVENAIDEGIEIAIMTRWVEDDLGGHFLEQAELDPNEWLIYAIPGIAEENDPLGREVGEPLWPERFSLEFYNKERAKNESTFQIVYQHHPEVAGGDIFKSREDFRPLPVDFYRGDSVHPSVFDTSYRFTYIDPAFSKKESACFSVIITGCVDSRFNLYIVDLVRLQVESPELETAIVDVIRRLRPHAIAMEDSAFRTKECKSIAFNVMNRAFCTIQVIPSTHDKIVRARLPAGKAAHGSLFVDLDAPWANQFVNECLGFPRVKYKDDVDGLSGITEMVLAAQVQGDGRPVKMRYGG
jgi:predicted phage terminase large subunit-like protein